MSELAQGLDRMIKQQEVDKAAIIDNVVRSAEEAGYEVADVDGARPWGGFVRFETKDGDNFVTEFFPEIDPVEARLGNADAELSPKILIVTPNQRLSWQVHERRAERWRFLTDGKYHKSSDPDEMGEPIAAKAGDVVQFEAGECHRLVGAEHDVTLVAEIWQHTIPEHPSTEDDIIRLQDDYKR